MTQPSVPPPGRQHGESPTEPSEPPPASAPLPRAPTVREPQPPPIGPVGATERVATLDVLRGFALLGILLVNIELFRGPLMYEMLAGEAVTPAGADRVRDGMIAWLASGKFISSFAMLFGVGAAIIAGRAMAVGRSPRPLLARRYGWLMVFGLAHMFLLFPGDILFAYGIAGMLLLPFVRVRARTALWWAAGLIGVLLLITLAFSLLAAAAPEAAADDAFTGAFEQFFEERRDEAVVAYTEGGPGDYLRARAWEVVFVQGSTLFVTPWILSLFLVGFGVWRSGVLSDEDRRGRLFGRTAAVALPLGLALNAPLAAVGTLGGAFVGVDAEVSALTLMGATVGQLVGAPVLATGYLSALAWACERPAVLVRLGPLRQLGRMALTGYLLQSVLATGFFVGLGYYTRLDGVQALGVVAVIWLVVLVAASLWLRRYDRGPVEKLWRRLTYGRPAS